MSPRNRGHENSRRGVSKNRFSLLTIPPIENRRLPLTTIFWKIQVFHLRRISYTRLAPQLSAKMRRCRFIRCPPPVGFRVCRLRRSRERKSRAVIYIYIYKRKTRRKSEKTTRFIIRRDSVNRFYFSGVYDVGRFVVSYYYFPFFFFYYFPIRGDPSIRVYTHV